MTKLLFVAMIFGAVLQVGFAQDRYRGCLDSLKFPTAFTPDGNGVNDVFSIAFPCPPDRFLITIYNQWGVAVFKSEAAGFAWNRTGPKEVPLPAGVYVYTVTIEYLNEEIRASGDVTLLR